MKKQENSFEPRYLTDLRRVDRGHQGEWLSPEALRQDVKITKVIKGQVAEETKEVKRD